MIDFRLVTVGDVQDIERVVGTKKFPAVVARVSGLEETDVKGANYWWHAYCAWRAFQIYAAKQTHVSNLSQVEQDIVMFANTENLDLMKAQYENDLLLEKAHAKQGLQ